MNVRQSAAIGLTAAALTAAVGCADDEPARGSQSGATASAHATPPERPSTAPSRDSAGEQRKKEASRTEERAARPTRRERPILDVEGMSLAEARRAATKLRRQFIRDRNATPQTRAVARALAKIREDREKFGHLRTNNDPYKLSRKQIAQARALAAELDER